MASALTPATTSLRITNPGDEELVFCLEPWAREYALDAHSSLEVVFESESPGVPDVFHEPHRIVVYAWPGASARVLQNGIEINDRQQKG
jgi:hypothetical protein